MKTPKEIKKGLECCVPKWAANHWKTCDSKCPYVGMRESCRGQLTYDALALIEHLESHSPKWTNVAEHLPLTPGKYLVYSKVGTMYTSKFDPDIHKRWPHFGKVGVTHWMPRPEEPKE